MSIPSKDEAVIMAQLNIEEDASRYVRHIESRLMVWDGTTDITIDVEDHSIATYLVEVLLAKGFAARLLGKPGKAIGYYVRFS